MLSLREANSEDMPNANASGKHHNHVPTCYEILRSMTDNYTGSSLSKQEHTVINVGDPDGVPRLVSLLQQHKAA